MQVASTVISTALSTEKAVKEIIEWAGIRIRWLCLSTTASWRFDGGLGIDVDHTRFQLGGNLGKLIRQLLRRGNGQRRSIRSRDFFRLLPAYAGRNNGP